MILEMGVRDGNLTQSRTKNISNLSEHWDTLEFHQKQSVLFICEKNLTEKVYLPV